MKILYFTRGQTPHDLRFLRSLAQTDHQVAVLCLEEAQGRVWPEGIEELHWPESSTPSVRAFREVVRRFQPDVVHAGPIQQVAYIAARAGFRPLVTMSWGSDLLNEADQSLRSRWITRYTLQRSTLLAADCNTVVKKALEFGFHGPVKVFPWGVDLQHFTPGGMGALRRELGWEQEFVFLSNRTLEPLYGVEVIAWAFIAACQTNTHLRLLVFGKGSQEGKLRALFEKAGVMNRVHFGGFAALEQLPEIYHSTDVYLSASHSDGSSVSLLEALACGKPVIVSDIPSNREWVREDQQGWLFQDGNSSELAEKMLKAAEAAGLSEMAAGNRRLAEERADWQQNFAKLLSAYAEAVNWVKHK